MGWWEGGIKDQGGFSLRLRERNREDFFQNCSGCTSFPQRQCLQTGNLWEGHSQMPWRTTPGFGCLFVPCQAPFLPNWAQIAENKLSWGYPPPAGYQLSLKPKLLLSLDLHAYCSISREAPNPHGTAEVAAPRTAAFPFIVHSSSQPWALCMQCLFLTRSCSPVAAPTSATLSLPARAAARTEIAFSKWEKREK